VPGRKAGERASGGYGVGREGDGRNHCQGNSEGCEYYRVGVCTVPLIVHFSISFRTPSLSHSLTGFFFPHVCSGS
jgi:hypothetical protein